MHLLILRLRQLKVLRELSEAREELSLQVSLPLRHPACQYLRRVLLHPCHLCSQLGHDCHPSAFVCSMSDCNCISPFIRISAKAQIAVVPRRSCPT